jgi:hypothetical protein
VDSARDVDCKGPVLEMTAHGRARYQHDGAFHTEAKIKFAGVMAPFTPRPRSSSPAARWRKRKFPMASGSGSAPAELSPGDLGLGNDVTVRLRQTIGK